MHNLKCIWCQCMKYENEINVYLMTLEFFNIVGNKLFYSLT